MGILLGLLARRREEQVYSRLQMLDTIPEPAYHQVAEVVTVSEADRLAALERAGLVHPRAEAVTAPLFSSGGFFLAADKVQVKYEMLRAHLAERVPVTAAAAAHGYSRAAFYLVAASFEQAGMAGLLDERRGRRGPVKLSPEIAEFLRLAPPASGAALAEQVAERFGVVLHRRTIERARAR
jgi:transposase